MDLLKTTAYFYLEYNFTPGTNTIYVTEKTKPITNGVIIMKTLFFWLICNTSIDDTKQTSNKEIREAFIKDNPELKDNRGKYAGLIGVFLNGLYAPDLIKYNVGTRRVLYNIKVHDKPVKQITVTNLE